MLQSELWKISIDALRANKVKAFLTTLGVVIGSACIVLVVTISLVGRNYIITQIEGVGSNLVYAELIRTGTQANTLSDEITIDDMETIRREVPAASEVAATHDIQMAVVAGASNAPSHWSPLRRAFRTSGTFSSSMEDISTVMIFDPQ